MLRDGAAPGARRADQRSRPADAGRARGVADRLRRRGAAGDARSLLPRPGRDDDPRVRHRAPRRAARRGPVRQPGQWEAWRAETAAGGRRPRRRRRRAPPATRRAGGRRPQEARLQGAARVRRHRGDASRAPRRRCGERVAESERPENASDAAQAGRRCSPRSSERQAEVDRLYARWAELEAKLTGADARAAAAPALGTTFRIHDARRAAVPGASAAGPHRTITGGGPFRLAPGEVTDDTQMACCLAASLREQRAVVGA